MKNRIDACRTRGTRSFLTANTLVLAGFALLLTLGISSLALYTRTAAAQELDKKMPPVSEATVEFLKGEKNGDSLAEGQYGAKNESNTASAITNKIVFRRNNSGAPGADLYTMNPDGTGVVRATNTPNIEFNPAISPDGNRIAYDLQGETGNIDIYIINADGTNPVRLTTDPSQDQDPRFSPDGTKIIFRRGGFGPSDIYQMNLDGSNQVNLTNSPGSIEDGGPEYFVDGSRIIFERDGDIFVMNANGTNQTNITNTPNFVEFSPDISPLMTRIVFRSDFGEIHAMNADGSGRVNLGVAGFSPMFSPDGSKIVYRGVSPEDIFVMNSDGSNRVNLTNNTLRESDPYWGPRVPPPPPEIIVNITSDQADEDLQDDVCDVDEATSGEQCSLRAAIQTANEKDGPDEIKFDIPGGGIQTISPATNLPDITSNVSIRGFTQPGYVDKPLIQINGGGAGVGLRLATGSNGSRITALAVNRFGTGIRAESNDSTIEDVFVGIDADGVTIPAEPLRQDIGIKITGQNNTLISARDTTTGASNFYVTGNDQVGVEISGTGATNNRIMGVNFGYIGDKPPEEAVTTTHISILAGSANRVGGTTPGEENFIVSGEYGVSIDEGANDNIVRRNAISECRIGVDIIVGSDNQIGGTIASGERNHIFDNEVGIAVGPAVGGGVAAIGNKIYGNMIGYTRLDAFSGNDNGILVGFAADTEIGSGVFGQHNFISNSFFTGVVLTQYSLGTKLSGNFIGTEPTGTIPAPNRDGVHVNGSFNEITRNTISGNNEYGIFIFREDEESPIPTENLIDNNRIGLKSAENIAVPNDDSGIVLDGTGNTVTNNVISGNNLYGIEVRRNGNTIRANKIGTSFATDIAIPNGQGGMLVSSSSNTIDANVVSGNIGSGIVVARVEPAATPPALNILTGNFIGTNAAGTSAVPNTIAGIVLVDGVNNNTIGGTAGGVGNVISGNGNVGINLQRGTAGGALPPSDNKIQGNRIGTNGAGDAAIPNAFDGIQIEAALRTRIGGFGAEMPGARNFISGNARNGISLIGAASTTRISGNYIGTKADGTTALGNVERGIRVGNNVSGTIVGGTEPNAGNTIAFNGSNGISLTIDAGNNNIIDPNRIFGNVLAGIDIGENGFTPNDPADADVGPNKLQNYPTMTLALVGGDLIVSYQVDSAPAHSTYGGTGVYVEFFEADASGAGRDFLGFDHYLLSDYNNGLPGTRVKNLGNAVTLGIVAGDKLTATATDAEGNSSEFTPVVNAPGGAPGFEGDVAPRPDGDGNMLSTDITQLRRFVSGLDVPGTTTNEIQRADCAPRSTFGDGVLTSSDVVQGRRYVAGLDPSTPSGGPASRSFISESSLTGDLSSILFTREMRVGQSTTQPGHKISIPIEMTSNGNETAMSFTIEYDASLLTNPRITLGKFAPSGSTLTFNTNEPSRIGIVIDSHLPMNTSAMPLSIVSVTFDVIARTDNEIAILLTDSLAARAVSDSSANSLSVTYHNRVIKIAGKP